MVQVKIRASINKGNGVSHEQYLELPEAGMAAEEVKARLKSRVRKLRLQTSEGYRPCVVRKVSVC